jgi:hypothetical protein
MQRETNYTNQIKELRKQNERLRKQAKISKALVAKHQRQSSSGVKKSKTVLSTDRRCTPPPLYPSSTESHYQQQLSPPLTPEAPNKQYIMDMKPAFCAQSAMGPPPPPTTDTAAWTDPMGLMMDYYTSPPSNLAPMADNGALMTMMMQWPIHQTALDKGSIDNTMPLWQGGNVPHYDPVSSLYIV